MTPLTRFQAVVLFCVKVGGAVSYSVVFWSFTLFGCGSEEHVWVTCSRGITSRLTKEAEGRCGPSGRTVIRERGLAFNSKHLLSFSRIIRRIQ